MTIIDKLILLRAEALERWQDALEAIETIGDGPGDVGNAAEEGLYVFTYTVHGNITYDQAVDIYDRLYDSIPAHLDPLGLFTLGPDEVDQPEIDKLGESA